MQEKKIQFMYIILIFFIIFLTSDFFPCINAPKVQSWSIKMPDEKIRLLLLEDNLGDARLIREQLARDENFFDVLFATNLSEGLEILRNQNFDAALLDLELPDSGGLKTIESLLSRNPSLPVIVLAGHDDENMAREAVRRGAQDYLIKGSTSISFLPRIIRYAMERKNTERELRNSLEKLTRSLSGTVKAMAMTVEMKDPYTADHQKRGALLAYAIAEEMRLDAKVIEGIQLASMIHDVGKISIPGEILSKPCILSSPEFNLIKTHPQVGYEILKGIEFPWPIAEIVLQHHERLDGSGYPYGLKNDEIIMEARILAVADVVEAIASHRPYRPAFGIDEAISEISRMRGVLYDTNVVKSCISLFQDKKYLF